jgi:hypothetical protein
MLERTKSGDQGANLSTSFGWVTGQTDYLLQFTTTIVWESLYFAASKMHYDIGSLPPAAYNLHFEQLTSLMLLFYT